MEPNYSFLDNRVKKITKQRKRIARMEKKRDKNPNKDPYEKNLEIQQNKETLKQMLMAVKPKIIKVE